MIVFYSRLLYSLLKKLFSIASLLFCFCLPQTAIPQSYQVFRYSTLEGLETTSVKNISQDKSGSLWLSTDDGFIRFDGNDFYKYLPSKYAISSLYSQSTLQKSDGRFFALTYNELLEIQNYSDPSNIKIKLIMDNSISSNQKNKLGYFNTLYEDKRQNTWVVSGNSLIRYTNNNKTKVFSFPESELSSSYLPNSLFVTEDSQYLYVVTTKGILYRYEEKQDKFLKIPLSISGTVNHALAISDRKILLASFSGLYEVTLNSARTNGKVRSFFTQYEINYIKKTSQGQLLMIFELQGLYKVIPTKAGYAIRQINNVQFTDINYIFETKDQDIWLATENGIVQMRQNTFSNQFSSFTQSSIQNITIEGDKIYFADNRKVFICKNSGKKWYTQNYYNSSNSIHQILILQKNILCIATYPAVLLFVREGKLIDSLDLSKYGKEIASVALDSRNYIWVIFTKSDNIVKLAPDRVNIQLYSKKETFAAAINLVKSGSQGNLYFSGTDPKNFLFRYDSKRRVFTNISKPIQLAGNKQRGFKINDILAISNKNIWIGSSLGLLLYNGKKIFRVNTGEHTISPVNALAIDKQGTIWFANRRGLNQYYKGTLITYNENDGLPSKSITNSGIVIDRANNLWCGTAQGIGFSNNHQKPLQTSMPVITKVESKQANNTSTARLLNMEIGSGMQLHYVSPSFPGKLTTYQTQILNYQKRWQPATKDKQLTITELAQGNYQIKIRAKQFGNYTWSEPKVITLNVHLPWYFSWWGITSAVVILILFIFVVYRIAYIYQRNKKAETERLEVIVNQRTEQITKQSIKLKDSNIKLENYKNNLENMVIKRTKELNEEKEKAEAASIAKTQFLANMSHEIRSPLNAIAGFSQILIQESKLLRLHQEFTRYLSNIKTSSENLSEIINNILDLAKIEADKMPLTEEAIALEQIFKGVYHIQKGAAADKNLHFTYQYDNAIPKYILTDRTKVNQVLMNLITNAIKFTPENKSVSISVKRDREKLIFKVTDEGIGIPEDKLEHIFIPFEQVDTSVTRNFGGTGLGLPITKKMIELMGGTIAVRSSIGKGAEFTVTLPFKETDIFEGEKEYDFDTIIFSKNNVVLVVEDNTLNQEMMEALFKQLNLTMYLAKNGQEGVDKALKLRPDLILMDMHMPVMDGIEATKKIRANEEIKRIPIVAVSADAFQQQQKYALAIGVDGYVTKPINFNKLMPYFIKYLRVDQSLEKTSKRKGKIIDVILTDLAEADKGELNSIVIKMKEIPIFNSKEILNELQKLTSLFEKYDKNTDILEKIEDAVYEGEEGDYENFLEKIAS